MRDHYDEVKACGAEIVAIGMGERAAAAAFRDRERIPFPLLIDPGRRTYEEFGLRKGSLSDIIGPGVVRRGLRSLLQGNRITPPRQDPLQLGGAAVVRPGGVIELEHRNRTSADLIPIERLIAVLKIAHRP